MSEFALDDAATAALYPLKELRREHLGALYGENLASSNLIEGLGFKSQGTLQIPGGASAIQALFHNHPSRSDDRYIKGARSEFSPEDMRQAQALGVPSYISSGEKIFKYEPKTGKITEVLALFPKGQIPVMLEVSSSGLLPINEGNNSK